ncbi:MAG: amidohydrolase family protein [Armatimonadetes bacterium]|nr:amidohydrolase family protein [Armatimonadota bacterium]
MSALVLRDALVLDGLGGTPAAREIWISEGWIVAPGSVPEAETESLGGRVVAPGLIDAHVHFCLDGGEDPVASYKAADAETLASRMAENARRTLEAGITTVRDLGSPTAAITALRAAIASRKILGPRLMVSGLPITIPNGHDSFFGGGLRGVGAVRGAVQDRARHKVDVIKVIVTRGGSSPGTDPRGFQFSDEEMEALVEEAQLARLPIAANAHGDLEIQQCITVGIDTIEHGSYASEESLAEMASRDIALVPTLSSAVRIREVKPYPEKRMIDIMERWQERLKAVRMAVEAEVHLVAGTDAGTAYTPHGLVAQEIKALAECGVPSNLALAAAWREAAAALGRPDIGTLAPGQRADLIVLAGDPLHDLGVLGAPLAVMKSGRWVRPLAS